MRVGVRHPIDPPTATTRHGAGVAGSAAVPLGTMTVSSAPVRHSSGSVRRSARFDPLQPCDGTSLVAGLLACRGATSVGSWRCPSTRRRARSCRPLRTPPTPMCFWRSRSPLPRWTTAGSCRLDSSTNGCAARSVCRLCRIGASTSTSTGGDAVIRRRSMPPRHPLCGSGCKSRPPRLWPTWRCRAWLCRFRTETASAKAATSQFPSEGCSGPAARS